jgi:hypothetical protein
MQTNACFSESEGPEVAASEILEFLIQRFNETLRNDNPRVPLVLKGLGLVALSPVEELLANYRGLLSSPYLPPLEILRRCVEIFQEALQCDPASFQYSRGQYEDDPRLDEKASRHVMMVALREGKQMLEENDVRFVKIFEMLGWISLQNDPEWLAEFEQVRKRFANDPEGLIEAGREILRDAVFRSRPSDRVQPFKN